MVRSSNATRQWIMVSIISGLAAIITYLLAVPFNPGIPVLASYLIFMFFGPLYCIASLALFKYLRENDNTPLVQIGLLFNLIAGPILTLMILMRAALQYHFQAMLGESEMIQSTQIAWRMAFDAGSMLQMGAYMTWNIFVLLGIIIWGIIIGRHPRFGWWPGASGIIIGLVGLILNFRTFPTPPTETGLFDIGPFVAIWGLIITIQLIRIYIKDYPLRRYTV